jgi:hypothetical protein
MGHLARAHIYLKRKGGLVFGGLPPFQNRDQQVIPPKQQDDNLCFCEFQEAFKSKAKL